MACVGTALGRNMDHSVFPVWIAMDLKRGHSVCAFVIRSLPGSRVELAVGP